MNRPATAIDAIADAHLTTSCELDPLTATVTGVSGYDGLMTDLSPDGHAARAQAARQTLLLLQQQTPADATDEITLAAMQQTLGLDVELFDAGEWQADLNVIASPVQGLRDVFDVAPTATAADWVNISARLRALPQAVDGYVQSLRQASERGLIAARRQFDAVIPEAEALAGAQSFFANFIAGPEVEQALRAEPAAAALRADLEAGADAARQAYRTLAQALRELSPKARTEDAVGRDRYALWSRAFVGSTLDLEETYAWGLDQLAQITAEQTALAAQIAGPGASVADAIARLDADPARTLTGTAALQQWMQQTSDAAVQALNGTAFTIPTPIQTLECRIAPTQSGGIYYTAPSDDFSRPGRMWWSVPAGVTTFNTWRELTTVYHEGVPGHHLQIGATIANRDNLNRWRRLGSWTSGHGEGWALYAERLMAELGFLDDPGDRLGMLDGQRMRAARVVFDIGVHLGLPAPDSFGGGRWDADRGWDLLTANVAMPEEFLRFEWLRYLGWPGQAPSYKVGQRIWENLREAARTKAVAKGEDFNLAAFHQQALSVGSVPLDVLVKALG